MLNLRISHENDRKPNFGDMQTYSKMVVFFCPSSFSYRGSYFKLGGEGSQILWIRCQGGLSHRVSLEVSSGV